MANIGGKLDVHYLKRGLEPGGHLVDSDRFTKYINPIILQKLYYKIQEPVRKRLFIRWPANTTFGF